MDSINFTFKDSIFGNTARTNSASLNPEMIGRNYRTMKLRSENTSRKIKNQLDNFLAYDSINKGEPSKNYSDFAKLLISGNINIPKVKKKYPTKLKQIIKPLTVAPSLHLKNNSVNLHDFSPN
jgi:hypothetical protein